MSFEEALEIASREDRFKAALYAMNTLLIHKGVYTKEEFEVLFVEWVLKEQRRSDRESPAHDAAEIHPI
jgi:hypothetical protein